MGAASASLLLMTLLHIVHREHFVIRLQVALTLHLASLALALAAQIGRFLTIVLDAFLARLSTPSLASLLLDVFLALVSFARVQILRVLEVVGHRHLLLCFGRYLVGRVRRLEAKVLLLLLILALSTALWHSIVL